MAAIPNNWQGTPLTFHPNGKSVGMWMIPRDTDEGVCMEAHSYKPIFLTPFSTTTAYPDSFANTKAVTDTYDGAFKRGAHGYGGACVPPTDVSKHCVDNHDPVCPAVYARAYTNGGSENSERVGQMGWDNKGELVYKDRLLPYTTKHGFAQGNLKPNFIHRQSYWEDGWDNIPNWGGTSCTAEVTFGNLTWRARTSEHLTLDAKSFLYYNNTGWADPSVPCFATPALWLPDADDVDTVRFPICPMVYKKGYLIVNDNDYTIDGMLYWSEAVDA